MAMRGFVPADPTRVEYDLDPWAVKARGDRAARDRAQQMVFDYAYAEATIENNMRDAVAGWRAPLPEGAGYMEMAKRIGDLLCIGVEQELRRRQER